MRFDYIFIGFLLFSLFIIGGSMMIVDFNTNYNAMGANLSSGDLEKFSNTTDEVFNVAGSAKEKVLEGDVSSTQSWESMTTGSYSAIRLVTNSYKLFQSIANTITEVLQIPPMFATIAFLAFTILTIFSVIYMVFRFIPR